MVGQAFTLRYIPAREDRNGIGVFRNRDHPQRVAIETLSAWVRTGDRQPQRMPAQRRPALSSLRVLPGADALAS